MPRLVLLTGLQGIGKTTVATSLKPPFYERIHFGGLLRDIVEHRIGSALTHEAFRSRFFETVDGSVVHEAVVKARQRVAASDARVCVLDSHAVSQTPLGLKATPDNAERLQLLTFSAIVHLSAAECADRVIANATTHGRQPMTALQVLTAEHLQLSVDVLYASVHDCPVLVVPASGTVDETVERVDQALRSLFPFEVRGA